ncbi:MAG: sigma 54-interacting transcriptional regulator [bacterium]
MEFIKKITKRKLFVILTLIYVTVSLGLLVATAVQSQQAVNKQHPGFLVFDNGLVFGMIDRSWSGSQAGLQMYDFIESYDGKAFQGTSQLFQDVNARLTKSPVNYIINRHGEKRTLHIAPMSVTQDFANIYFHIFLFCGLFTILTGLAIFVIRPLAKGAFLFFVICNTIGIFEILLADMFLTQRFLLLLQVTIAFYAVVNLHMIYYMIQLRRSLKQAITTISAKMGISLTYLLVMGLALFVYYFSGKAFFGYKILLFTSNVLFFIGGVLVFVTASYLYFTTKSSTTKRRLLVYLGLNVSCLIPFIVYVAHNVSATLIPIEVILIQLSFPFITTYVLFKYNFLDLRFTPKRKFFYLGFAVFIPILFLVDFFFVIPLLHKYAVATAYIYPIVFVSILIKLVALIYAAYARIIDRIFFPSTFKFRDIMASACESVLKQHTSDEILTAFVSLMKDQFEIGQVYCYYQNTQLDHFKKQTLLDGNQSSDELYQKLPASVTAQEMPLGPVDYAINEFSSNQDVSHAALQILIQNNLNLLLPLKFQKKVHGFVLLGPKPSFVPYTTEDLTSIQSILATTTVALVNSKHHESLMALHEQLKKENKRLKEEIRNQGVQKHIIGADKGLKTVIQKVDMIQNSSISVLLYGETGTGKEVVAHAIHERSQRSAEPIIKVNCAAIPEGLFESELFGHEKGSFTGATDQKIGLFEAANGGTLFLDEIGEVPLHIQPKLLRALQEKEIQRVGNTEWISVDVRIVAATNRDLELAVKENKFRQDLFYRLNVLPIFIPPLRDRQEDIEDLLTFFISKYTVEMKKNLKAPTHEDIRKIRNYPWPGNVREMQNVIERSVALSEEGERIRFFHVHQDSSIDQSLEKIFDKGDFYFQMDELKKQVIKRAITRAEGNKSKAARDLGLHQVSLYKMVKQLGVE